MGPLMTTENMQPPKAKQKKPAFELTGVTVAFDVNGHPETALAQINLSIAKGEFVALCGANGSGKSTLARVLAGLLDISAGRVEIGGQAFSQPHRRTSQPLPRVQMVFQNPESQLIGETVWEEVSFGPLQQGVQGAELEHRVCQALARVGIQHLLHAAISTLSGGQKQRVCIADCLVQGADILIFDEATAMLDEGARQQVLAAVGELHREGTTIVWITQHLEELPYATRVIALARGLIAFDDTPTAFFYGKGIAEGREDNSAADPNRHNVSPCRNLGFQPPFVIEVVEELIRKGWEGWSNQTPPMTPTTLLDELKAVKNACP